MKIRKCDAANFLGQTFGQATVTGNAPPDAKGRPRWECLCSCGKTYTTHATSIPARATKSCGCRPARFKHGHSPAYNYSPEYVAWGAMIQRCGNPNHTAFKDYGGRGITICERWKDFRNFFADMGVKPSRKHQIDRIENNGNYEPENCRWGTVFQQRRNTRRNRMYSLNGRTMCNSDWAKELGINPKTLSRRVKRNGVVIALTMKKGIRNKKH